MGIATKQLQAKSKALVISDNQAMIKRIEAKFSNAGWLIEASTTHSMMGRGSAVARNHHCIVMVIDDGFRKRFGNIISEMGAVIRNCSIHTPIYLLFEGDYESYFSSWLQCVKRFFELDNHHQSLLDVIQCIVKLEKECVPRSAFFSPMDAF